MRKELGAGVRRGQWEAGDFEVPNAPLWADASRGAEGWMSTSRGSAPVRAKEKKKEKKEVKRNKNNIFKE